jgi:hypothetical protein
MSYGLRASLLAFRKRVGRDYRNLAGCCCVCCRSVCPTLTPDAKAALREMTAARHYLRQTQRLYIMAYSNNGGPLLFTTTSRPLW